ncbi:RNA-directed DNA polymerase, eukaryota, reverse transcriptase zinc-binding domain protein [Tanacetum coccineum]
MQMIDGLLAKELAQKTKIKWVIEGDENSNFFYGMLNKKRSSSGVRGVMVDGVWVDDPQQVKKEFYDHFSARFSIPNNKDASILMDFPKKISEAQLRGLECEVSNDEIKKAVWDCGTEKAPGPDGFTFGFFRHFWYLIHNDVYDAVRKFGFGDKWCKWIQCCLNSSRGSILVNGCPTEEFQYGKGLKQGDPLSPFLFILIMESLHLSFQRIVDEGMFKGIKLGGDMVNLSHMFYADDAVFVGQWCESNITTLVHVLDCFYKVSGLRINMSKSKIMGVHVDDEKVNRAADKLGCLVFKTPFAYLGSIVGGNMSRKHLWNETVDKVKMRLSKWKMNTLSIGGRLTLIKSDRGRVGISKSLLRLNKGLLENGLGLFITQKNTLWARVIQALHGVDGRIGTSLKGGQRSCWTSIIQEVNNLGQKGIDFMSLISIKLGNGEKTRFWEDKWCADGILKTKYPRLYALESCKLISVGTKLSHSSICSSFRRNPRGGNELDQLVRLEDDLKGVVLSSNDDRWVWELEREFASTPSSYARTCVVKGVEYDSSIVLFLFGG